MTLPCPEVVLRQCARACFLFLSIIFLYPRLSVAQETGNVIVHAPLETTADTPLHIAIDLLHGEMIEKAFFLYRTFGSSDYTRLEMDLRGNTGSIHLLPEDVRSPFIEYYFVFQTRSGALEAFPQSPLPDPISRPPVSTLKITVRPEDVDDPQIIFLSPDPNAALAPEDIIVSVSLLRADTSVDIPATRLLIDDADVTAEAVFSDDIIVYVPENFSHRLAPGRHRAILRLFTKDGKPYRSSGISFFVHGEYVGDVVEESDIQYGVSTQLESRHERVSGVGTWFNRGGVQLSARKGDWTARSNVFITSDEESNRQPQNRFFAGVSSSWISAGYGDRYPNISDLILNGKRVRGLHSSLTLGFLNVDMTLGKTTRAIEGSLLKVIGADTVALEQQRDPNSAYAQIDQQTWGKFSYGTFERDLFAIRPSFGSGKTWQFGLSWLKSKDDMQSIRFGTRPQENLVVGTDFFVRIMNNVELAGEAAFSAFNSDISSGNFTDAYIDSVYPDDAQAIKDARNILDNFITVNDNLRPLSFKKPATLAYNLSLAFNVLDNALKATYLFRGSEYNSFGQTFLRNDIKGFNINDRIRLADNQVFVTLGYERLEDNTVDTKPSTTVFSTINAAVSYLPRVSAPSVTLGYTHIDNTTDLASADTLFALSALDDRTHRLFLQSSYRFHLGVEQIASMTFSTSDRKDRSIRRLDVTSLSVGFAVTSTFNIPLQTSVEFVSYQNDLPGTTPGSVQEFNYSTFTLSGRYGIVKDILITRCAISPTFGNFTRTLISAGTDWTVIPAMTFLLDYSYFHQESGFNDSIWSLRYRYDL
ncbi:MAG: hypothetical protein ACKVRP_06670 [Bacteroidota bacterium]